MGNNKNFINGDVLMSSVSDIENYIDKNYKLTQLEYELLLSILKERLNMRKLDAKKDNMISSTIDKVKKMMIG